MSDALFLRPSKVPSYRRHKAKGLAVVTIRGRDIYLGKYGSASSKELYRRLIGEYLLTGTSRSVEASDQITIVEVMAAYLKFARQYYRKGGKPTREYEQSAESCRFLKAAYGRTPAAEFGPLALKAVRQKMIEAGHCRQFINKNIGRIRRMFKWAAAEELIPADVPQALLMVAGLRRGRTEAPDHAAIPPVEEATVDATLPHLPEVVADMVRLQRITGMRPAELCQMRPCNINREREVWLYRPESHKTQHHGRERIILLGPRAQEILLRYLVRDAQTYCFRPCDSEAKRRAARNSARKTPAKQGHRPGTNRRKRPRRQPGLHYTTDSYRRAITRACEKARVTPWSPNQLRHAAATEIRREFGLEAAQVILGHSNAAVTQIYAERDLAKGIEVARRLG